MHKDARTQVSEIACEFDTNERTIRKRIDRYKAALVLEGDSIHVDGEGTLLSCRSLCMGEILPGDGNIQRDTQQQPNIRNKADNEEDASIIYGNNQLHYATNFSPRNI